ncbi:MAG TPA: HAD-IA family hydrolase [Geobacteraceae bacterium]
MTVKLIIFDLDGTLVDSIDDLVSATNHVRAIYGRSPYGREDVRAILGQGGQRLIEQALEGASPAELARALELYIAYNAEHLLDRTALFPGVRETIARLAADGMRMAILSNKHSMLSRKMLEGLGLDGYFAVVHGPDSLPWRKPSPEPVLRLLADFGVATTEGVIVGDSINDVAAGRNAGICTVGCSYGYGDPAELADADYRIASLPEFLQLPLFG